MKLSWVSDRKTDKLIGPCWSDMPVFTFYKEATTAQMSPPFGSTYSVYGERQQCIDSCVCEIARMISGLQVIKKELEAEYQRSLK